MEELDYDAPRDPWDFTIEGVKVSWVPELPFLKSDGSEDGNRIIDNIERFIENQWETEDGFFKIPPTGPVLLKSIASPYAVLYAILYIYGEDRDLLSFSENAPKWTDMDPIEPGSEDVVE